MEPWQAVVLGLIEGLTEYLPVSSTGHLLIAQRLMGLEGEAANSYAIAIQGGAIAAILGLYRRRLAQVARGVARRDPAGAGIARGLAVAFLPAAALGFAAGSAIERHLFGPWPIAAAWAAGGVLLLVLPARLGAGAGRPLEELTLRAAWIVGLFQCAALWPGVSRSLATILGGLAAGLSLAAAVEFSFLLGVLTLLAASAYKAIGGAQAMLAAYGVPEICLGFATAWASAVFAVRRMVAWLATHGLGVFGWWRIAAAGLVVLLVLSGRL
jgi:undecaprenyl-diphosphatase